jgi:hypothetical protein
MLARLLRFFCSLAKITINFCIGVNFTGRLAILFHFVLVVMTVLKNAFTSLFLRGAMILAKKIMNVTFVTMIILPGIKKTFHQALTILESIKINKLQPPRRVRPLRGGTRGR